MKLWKTGPVLGPGSSEQGFVLLLSLLFLTALALLGLSASADAILQNQLASNFQESERVQASARTALRWAERWLFEQQGQPPEICAPVCNGLMLHARGDLPAQPELAGLSWWQTNGHTAGIDPLSGTLVTVFGTDNTEPPLWVIEVAHEVPAADDGSSLPFTWYRILARATGQAEPSISIVESIVVRTWSPANITLSTSTGTEQSGACPHSGPIAECGRVAWRQLR